MRSQTRRRLLGRQTGDSRIGCLLWLILMGAFALVAWQAIPAKLKATELEDFMERQAESAGITRRINVNKMKKAIVERAEELDLPVTAKDIEIHKNAGRVRISCKYTVTLDLLVHQYDWDFNLEVDRSVLNI